MTPTPDFDIRPVHSANRDGIVHKDFTWATPFGYRRAAYLLAPGTEEIHAAILYLHWFEPWAATSNRRQFLDEARHMARKGAACLLVETLWSDDDFFIKRTQADDEANTQRVVVEIRQAMDILLDQPGVDPGRFACVGHDFGAMYAVLAGSQDPRPGAYVLMAGTPRFADWYLYYPDLEGEALENYLKTMEPYGPASLAAKLAPAPILFQFGRDDPHVPVERAQAFFDVAAEPKELRWYDCGHGLNDAATAERIAWLETHLGLPKDN